ncbi:hypothetical protein R1flu_013321 [Riccia fluitans]|uniref:Uncharacterized protein n=1 Tax=Riccia fluitans TaxID=41844 RepID=A0ABD1YD96_9MARC
MPVVAEEENPIAEPEVVDLRVLTTRTSILLVGPPAVGKRSLLNRGRRIFFPRFLSVLFRLFMIWTRGEKNVLPLYIGVWSILAWADDRHQVFTLQTSVYGW